MESIINSFVLLFTAMELMTQKNECKISFLSFGLSDWVWVNDKKQLFHPDLLCVKTVFCIENAKLKKIKTWPRSKINIDEGHVLGNATFSPRRENCFYAHPIFFSKIENDHSFFSN